MAAKRSPILGYNHNVRFRGIVFHIQTEDSGVGNPHVFSHLFHGGVILSTRKLVYDAGSNEDAVKSLMQAQHKAVMKDLRRGAFDDKIDSYLADAPGLLPRESEQLANAARATADARATSDALEALTAEAAVEAAAIAMVPAPPDAITDEPSAPAIEIVPESTPPAIELIEPTSGLGDTEPVPTISYEAPLPPATVIGADDDPSIELIAVKPAAFLIEDDDLIDATPVPELSRAPTERVPERAQASMELEPEELELPPPPRTRTDVSAALRAIQMSDEDIAAAFADDAPAEIHSPAPPSAPVPPGVVPERVGEYHLARKVTAVEPAPPPARPPIPRPTPVSSRIPTPSHVRPPTPRPPTSPSLRTPPTPTPTPASRVSSSTFRNPPPAPADPRTRAPTPAQPASSLNRPTPPSPVPRVMTPSARPPDGTTPVSSRPPIAPPRRPATGGGVVVSRPAVIVGGKNPTTPPAKVRRAKDAESFGGDLISERSLDEVILAYLSEDNSED